MHSWCWNLVKWNFESSLGLLSGHPVQSKLIHGGDYLTGRRIHLSYLLQLGAVAYDMQTRPNWCFSRATGFDQCVGEWWVLSRDKSYISHHWYTHQHKEVCFIVRVQTIYYLVMTIFIPLFFLFNLD